VAGFGSMSVGVDPFSFMCVPWLILTHLNKYIGKWLVFRSSVPGESNHLREKPVKWLESNARFLIDTNHKKTDI
jgi:hypothetical protein